VASRRDQIRMTEQEMAAFLDRHILGVLGTVDKDGCPHMVNTAFLAGDEGIAVTSFAAAQKVRNIERTGTASLLVEVNWPYSEVRGVLVSGPARIVTDIDAVIDVSTRIRRKHAAMESGTPSEDIAKHAAKRCVLYIEPRKTRSWDHTKLGGVY
jgi:nitroimidazol reductase NimA-like FMN-containing flavoprotein (pyridoxamine 5'-phosphate oxidase superfamily)